MRSDIIKTSPFRAQSQITPEDEKELIGLFRNIQLNKNLFPDVVIIKNLILLKTFLKLKMKNTLFMFSKFYEIYLTI